MALHNAATFRRLIALTVGMGLIVATGACSVFNNASTDGGEQTKAPAESATHGDVAIFTPSDALTISQQTPINTWNAFTSELTTALKDEGIKKRAISTHSDDTLEKQSQAIQDYVVEHVADGSVQADDVTLVVAPIYEADDAAQRYGDYVSRHIEWTSDTASDDADAADSSDSSAASEATGPDGDADAGSTTSDTADYEDSASRLVSALNLAQNSGMHVVLVSNTIDGFVPDVFVQMSTPEQIGTLQAEQLVSKLALDKASKDNPKSIEVLLPYSGPDDTDLDSDTFAHEAFHGIWKVLQPYFADGRAYSPSGLLDANSTDEDWTSVIFDATDSTAITQELSTRLDTNAEDTTAHTAIDGVIALNDHVAAGVIEGLHGMGYIGSSADVNPSITISGIVDNITGKPDLNRAAVPDPVKAPADSTADGDNSKSSNTDETEQDDKNAQWPIVTGYGAYIDSMPEIVNGHLWMTALENRKQIANDTAQVCKSLNDGLTLDGLSFIGKTTINGKKNVRLVSEDPLTVSASNLKKALIEPGYISLADAGL